MSDSDIDYFSYKKVIIFGAEGSGKSTLSKSLETGKFSEQNHTESSKYIYLLIINLLILLSRC